MDTLFVWVKNIVSFLLIMSLIFELLPTKDYGKYVRVSAGMILLIVIISPFVNAMGLGGNLDFYLSWENLKSQIGLNTENTNYLDYSSLEKQRLDGIINEYKKNLKEQIQSILKNDGLEAGEIILVINSDPSEEEFGQIISMEIYGLKHIQQKNENVERVVVPQVNIGETTKANDSINSDVIIKLKKQLAERFFMDMNRILINGG